MLSHDLRLNPGVPQPTPLDGVNPSFIQWSEVIAFLAVTDYQEFIPLLATTASSKDVIEPEAMFKGVLSDLIANIKKKESDKLKAQSENKSEEITALTAEIAKLKETLEQKKSTLLKVDFFLCYTLLHVTSGDPNVMVRRIMRTSNSDSGAVTGLDTWHQVTHHLAGSSKTRTVSLLKQADRVTCRVEC